MAVYLFYAETCGRIMLPVFAAAAEEGFDEYLAADREQTPGSPSPWAEVRWSPADWPHQHDDIHWARHGAYWAWSKALTDAAPGPGHPQDLVVVALDDDADLVSRTLTDTEIRCHLPHLHHAQDT